MLDDELLLDVFGRSCNVEGTAREVEPAQLRVSG